MTKSDSIFSPTFVDHHLLPDITFHGHCLINNIFIAKEVIDLYIYHTQTPWIKKINTDFTLNNCLFGSVKLKRIVFQKNTGIANMAQDLILI